jgi:hypothetical protein
MSEDCRLDVRRKRPTDVEKEVSRLEEEDLRCGRKVLGPGGRSIFGVVSRVVRLRCGCRLSRMVGAFVVGEGGSWSVRRDDEECLVD